MQHTYLNDLNRDMLVKLVATIQEEYKKEKMTNERLLASIKDYNAEIFKRKTKIIKKDLERFPQFEDVINDITKFDLKAADVSMLSLVFGKHKFVIRTYIRAGYKLFLITHESAVLYNYYSGIGHLIPATEKSSIDIFHKKYIDFVKFLHAQKYIEKIMLYLCVDKKVEDF